ncbi:MAG: FAD-dependent oxidoreductase [Kiritimatiellaeota bacterium]|nr:FAD-dependent oxidoreductase [Kiritimatiellota bacterium]
MKEDPICHMQVDEAEAVRLEHDGRLLFFCSEGCRKRFLDDHGRAAPKKSYELIIIGAGPAGLTAAVYAANLRIDSLVLSRDLGGQAIDSTKIKNYMGYDFITGPELVKKFRDQLIHSNYVDHIMDSADRIAACGGGFEITTGSLARFRASTVIVATGMTRRKLNVPGEERFQRKGLFYGNLQDYSFVTGEDVVVVGGGNSAMQIADKLLAVARNIHLVSNLEVRRSADAADVARLVANPNVNIHENCVVEAIEGTETVSSVRVRRLAASESVAIPAKGVFVAVGLRPNSALVAELVEINERGEVKIGPDCRTSAPGIFAAGDVTNAYGKRIVIACGEGAKAALAVRQHIMETRKSRKERHHAD